MVSANRLISGRLANIEIDRLNSLLWHSEMDWSIAILIAAA